MKGEHSMMRAVVCHEFGDMDRVSWQRAQRPAPADGEVLIDVHAASLTHMDLLTVQGKYQVRPKLPFVVGGEAAGVISAVGRGVRDFAVGDRIVCGGLTGAFGEQMAASHRQCARIPPSVDMVTASVVRQTYGTARHALVTCGRLREGEAVVVTGAAGGVGIAAMQMAQKLGARVIGVVGSAGKEQALSEMGFASINHRRVNARRALQAWAGERGIDIAVDLVGGDIFGVLLRSMRRGGRMVSAGFASGNIPSLTLDVLLTREVTVTGAWFGTWAQRNPDLSGQADAWIFEMIDRGEFKPHVHCTLDLSAFREGFRLVCDRLAVGRVAFCLQDNSAGRTVL